jgi:hypothetical protein
MDDRKPMNLRSRTSCPNCSLNASGATHLLEPNLAPLQEVIQATRSGNDNLHAVLDVAELGPFRCATVNTSVADARRPSKLVRLRFDLHRQLSRRRQNE